MKPLRKSQYHSRSVSTSNNLLALAVPIKILNLTGKHGALQLGDMLGIIPRPHANFARGICAFQIN